MNFLNLLNNYNHFSFTNWFNYEKIGVSDQTNFVPIYSLLVNEGYKFDNKLKVFIYYDIKRVHRSKNTFTYTSRYFNDFNSILSKQSDFNYVFNGTSYNTQLLFSSLIRENKFLTLFAIDTKYVLEEMENKSLEQFLTNIDTTKIVYYVNNDMFLPENKKILKIINLLIRHLKSINVDIIYTNDINSKIFNTGIKIPEFKTIKDRKEFYSVEMSKFIEI